MANFNYKFPWQPPGGVDLNGNVRGMTLNVAPPTAPFYQPPEDSPIDLSCRKGVSDKSNEINGWREIGTIIVDNSEVAIKLEKDDPTDLSTNSKNPNEIQKPESSKQAPLCIQHKSSEKKTNKPLSKGGRKTVEPIIEFLKERSNKRQTVNVNSASNMPGIPSQNRTENTPASIVPCVPLLLIANQNIVLDTGVQIKTEPVDEPVLTPSATLVQQVPQTSIIAVGDPKRLDLNENVHRKSANPEKKTTSSTCPSGKNAQVGTVSREDSPMSYANVINITPLENITTPAAKENDCHPENSEKEIAASDVSFRGKHGKCKRRVPREYRRKKICSKKKKKNVQIVVIGAEQCLGEDIGCLGSDAINLNERETAALTSVDSSETIENFQEAVLKEPSNLVSKKPAKKTLKSKVKVTKTSEIEPNLKSPKTKKKTKSAKKGVEADVKSLEVKSQEVTVKTKRRKSVKKRSTMQKKPVIEVLPSVSETLKTQEDETPTKSVVCDKELEIQARSMISSSMKKMLPSAKKATKSPNDGSSKIKSKKKKTKKMKVVEGGDVKRKKRSSERKETIARFNFDESHDFEGLEVLEEDQGIDDVPIESDDEWLPENESHDLRKSEPSDHDLEGIESRDLDDEEAEEEAEEEEEESHNCNSCNKELKSLDELQNHTCSAAPQQLSCVICNDTFQTKEEMISHLETHFCKKLYYCQYCGRGFKNVFNCRRHEGNHKDGSAILCNICSLTFDTVEARDLHKRIHMIKKLTFPYSCPVCSKVLPNSASYARHEKIHWAIKPHKCRFCDRRFTEKQNCLTHERRHLKERPFQCDNCPAKFYSQGEKIVHQKIHSGEKNYQCMTCKKCFRTDSILRSHLLVHLNLRPFKCEYCNKGFKRKRDCEIHVRGHFGIKPFSCEICDKSFTSRGNLNQHHRLHESLESSTLKCKFCERHFRWHHSLSIHEEWHKKLQCRICSAQCTNRRSLRLHEQSHLQEATSGNASSADAKSKSKSFKSRKGDKKRDGKRRAKNRDEKKQAKKRPKTDSDEDDVPLTKIMNVKQDKDEVQSEQSQELQTEREFIENTLSLQDI